MNFQMSNMANYNEGCYALAEALEQLVPNKDARILDVGAGSGQAGRAVSIKK